MSQASELLKHLRGLGAHLALDGETLRLNAPRGVMTQDVQAQLKALKPEIIDHLRALHASASAAQPLIGAQIPRIERTALMPLSLAQQRLWFLNQMDPEDNAYTLLFMFRMQGKVHAGALEQALRLIVGRHESLRTVFVQQEGTPFTTIRATIDLPFSNRMMDVAGDESLASAADRFATEAVAVRFDLENGPLVRAYLLRVAEDDHVLVLTMHHIIADGWSLGVLLRELEGNYRTLLAGETPRLSPLPVQYVDYAAWQQQWLAGSVLNKQMAYWRKQLEGAPAVSVFPPDHRSQPGRAHGRRMKRILSREFASELTAFSRSQESTLFMTMLSAFFLLLARHSGQKDVVVGSPSANRNRSELSSLIGFFVNNLVLRVQVDDGISFSQLLKRVRESTLGAYEHQDAPFDELVRTLQGDRDPNHAPLFQTMFILQNFQIDKVTLADLKVTPLDITESIARFDLTVEVFPYLDELHVYFDYRADLYEAATIEALLQSYEHVLHTVVLAPETPVDAVPVISPHAKEQLLAWGKPAAWAPPADTLLSTVVAQWAEVQPRAIAVRAGVRSLTYADLLAQVDSFSHRLRRAGVTRGTLVPVCLQRSTNLVVALLAVMRVGGAYIPLDPIYPRQRIAGILDDVQPAVVITESALQHLTEGGTHTCILLEDGDESSVAEAAGTDAPVAVALDDLAYVIFTSGSTGKPKGVEITHGALMNFLESMRTTPGFTSADRLLAVTTISFDIAGLELFLPLYAGGELIVAQAPGDLPALLADLERENPTVLQATPALWQMLVSAGWPGDPQLSMLCGGEALTPQLAAELLPRGKALWNMYGPTETTIWSSALRVKPPLDESIPLGGPIRNTTFFVLDARLEPVPVGVAGELFIGGDSVARGYFKRPDLTGERFISPPFAPALRLYRTGDLVRRRWSGRLDFLGRVDFQVKLRGFRIELGEIEYALRALPGVAECVVVLGEAGGNKELVAYIVPHTVGSVQAPDLRSGLRERLPEYMVPAHFVLLPHFPRLPNGKLDRSKLPAPVLDVSSNEMPPIDEPMNAIEAAIARVFRDLLQTERIGLQQRFFDIGAHSLMLVKAYDRLRRELDSELRLVSLFQYPSVATLARHIAQRRMSTGEHAHAVE